MEHNQNNKLGARYTRARRPVSLAYQESCASRSAAAKREAAVRKMTRQQKWKLIEKHTIGDRESGA